MLTTMPFKCAWGFILEAIYCLATLSLSLLAIGAVIVFLVDIGLKDLS